MENSVLRLVFDAPIQSFGCKSNWDSRDTQYYPTKSLVINLIANAMGLDRGDTKIDELARNLKVHVRIDKKGSMIDDLQTVNYPVFEAGNRYSANPNSTTKSKAIKKNKNGEDFHPLLHKYYIVDAFFSVYIEGEKELILDCYNSLLNPERLLYLGRKSCPPAAPIIQDEPIFDYENIDTIMKDISRIPIERIYKEGITDYYFECIIEDVNENIVCFDNPDSRGQKYYKPRTVKKVVFSKNILKENGVYVFK